MADIQARPAEDPALLHFSPNHPAPMSSEASGCAGERGFVQADFDTLRVKQVYEIAKSQAPKWPADVGPLNSKTSKDVLRAILCNPRYGFTTTAPIPSPSRAPQKRRGRPPTKPIPVLSLGPSTLQGSESLGAGGLVQPAQSRPSSLGPSGAPSAAATKQAADPFPKVLNVFIEDSRQAVELGRVCQPLLVSAVLIDESMEVWGVTAGELLTKLQASPAAILENSIPLSIQYSHHADPRYFVHITRHSLYVKAVSPGDLVLFKAAALGGTLYIYVRCSGPDVAAAEKFQGGCGAPPTSTSNGQKPAAKDVANDPEKDRKVVAALTDRLSEHPEYRKFSHAKSKKLQNPDIVEHWQFIDRFFHAAVGQSIDGKRVFRHHIHSALMLSETTVNQAIKAARLISTYADESQNPASFRPEVSQQLSLVTSKPSGSMALFRFLEAQESCP